MFNKIYIYILNLAKHRLAAYYLAVIGFFESIIFPIPADVMLAPMCLANTSKAYRYALILSITSVLGGVIGYFIGYFFSDFALELFHKMGKEAIFEKFKTTFNDWGFWFVFIAGFTPFPYKVVTISSGVLQVFFPVFLLGSIISRSLRFFLIAWAIRKGGEKLEKTLLKYIEWLGWGLLIIIVFFVIFMYIR